MEQLSYKNDGEGISRMVKGVPYFDESGEIQYVICYIFDTSEKRKVIEDLTSSNLTVWNCSN